MKVFINFVNLAKHDDDHDTERGKYSDSVVSRDNIRTKVTDI